MPKIRNEERSIIKFLLVHLLYGTVAAMTFGSGVLFLDIGNIRSLAWESGQPAMAIFLFYFGLFVTFGSVAMGIGVMSIGLDEDD